MEFINYLEGIRWSHLIDIVVTLWAISRLYSWDDKPRTRHMLYSIMTACLAIAFYRFLGK